MLCNNITERKLSYVYMIPQSFKYSFIRILKPFIDNLLSSMQKLQFYLWIVHYFMINHYENLPSKATLIHKLPSNIVYNHYIFRILHKFGFPFTQKIIIGKQLTEKISHFLMHNSNNEIWIHAKARAHGFTMLAFSVREINCWRPP